MGIFSKIFGAKESKIAPQQKTTHKQLSNQVQIAYKPDLINSLKDDHKKLFAIYGKIIDLANNDDFLKIPGKLAQLKLALQGHVLVENVQFYVYVQERHKDDPINIEFIKDVRREMNGIARVVVDFVKKYQMQIFTNEVKATFLEELKGIGEALTQRIEMEESQLYTLYIQ